MKDKLQLDQMQLFCDISAAIAKQQPKLPADNRSNVVVKAANMIVAIYAMTNEEFKERYGDTGKNL